jgi:hypothetical protein
MDFFLSIVHKMTCSVNTCFWFQILCIAKIIIYSLRFAILLLKVKLLNARTRHILLMLRSSSINVHQALIDVVHFDNRVRGLEQIIHVLEIFRVGVAVLVSTVCRR